MKLRGILTRALLFVFVICLQQAIAQQLGTPYYVSPRSAGAHIVLDKDWQLGSRESQINSLVDLKNVSWITTQLPGSVQMALFHAGKLPDPYNGLNSKLYEKLDEQVWYYRTSFQLPAVDSEKRLTLCFDGVDYYTRVWFNGHLLGDHEGMFGGPSVEINQWAKADGNNDLVVEVRAANWGKKATFKPREPGTVIKPWSLAGGTGGEPFFPFGIWRPVRLEVTSPLHIERPFLSTAEASPQVAKLKLSLEIDSNVSSISGELHVRTITRQTSYANSWTAKRVPGPETVEFVLRDDGKIVHRETFPVDLVEGRNWLERTLTIPNPRLWWPNGMGDPHLYQVDVRLRRAGKVQDQVSFPFGIRTLQIVQSAGPRTQDFWENWQFQVNGKPFFVKGVNWMSADLLYNLPRKNYEWLLAMAQKAGIRMIRAWGGSLVETDDFYEECDRLGLLVWQEFALSNMLTADWPQQTWENQVAQNIFRLRNHPSLAVWCAGNESNPYAEANSASTGIFERTVRELDPTRPYRRTSPDGGSVHEYPDMDPTWYGKLYRFVPFMTETGMHNIPASIKKVVSPAEFEKPLSEMYSEQFAAKHPELSQHFVEFRPDRVPRMLSRASQVDDMRTPTIDSLAEATQIGAGEFYQIASEQVQDNYPVTTGLVPWVFKRSWPTIAIQLVDGFGQPTAPYYFVRRTYEQGHVSVLLPEILWAVGERFPLHVSILPSDRALSSEVTVRIFDPQLKEVWKRTGQVSSSKTGVQHLELDSFQIPASFRDHYFFVIAERRDPKGNLLSRSTYWPRVLAKMEEDTFRNEYRASPHPALTFETGPWLRPQVHESPTRLGLTVLSRTSIDSTRSTVHIQVANTGSVLSLPTQVQTINENCRSYFNDNFFVLSPGEKRELDAAVQCNEPVESADIRFSVVSWNADMVTSKPPLRGR